VLVIDDDPAICNLLSSFLHQSGYEVLVADTAIAALGFITLENPDLVILDLNLPMMSGEEVIGLARQKREQSFALIVLSVAEDIAERALELEADGFISKPFELTELLEVVKSHTRRN